MNTTFAGRILAAHNANGGSTFNFNGANLAGQDLYAVSIYPAREVKLRGPLTLEALNLFLQLHGDALLDPFNAIGTWFDSNTGWTYVDVVRLESNRRTAELLGRQHNQLAICYLKTGEIINL